MYLLSCSPPNLLVPFSQLQILEVLLLLAFTSFFSLLCCCLALAVACSTIWEASSSWKLLPTQPLPIRPPSSQLSLFINFLFFFPYYAMYFDSLIYSTIIIYWLDVRIFYFAIIKIGITNFACLCCVIEGSIKKQVIKVASLTLGSRSPSFLAASCFMESQLIKKCSTLEYGF